jgi:hypothetical protein
MKLHLLLITPPGPIKCAVSHPDRNVLNRGGGGGVIPFTSIATNSAHIKEDKDFNNNELYLRATIEAENRAINEITENLGNHFN